MIVYVSDIELWINYQERFDSQSSIALIILRRVPFFKSLPRQSGMVVSI